MSLCWSAFRFYFIMNYVGKGHGGRATAPAVEESKRLRGEGDKSKFIDLRFERWQVVEKE